MAMDLVSCQISKPEFASSTREKRSLLSLPNEILINICNHLIPHNDRLDTNACRPKSNEGCASLLALVRTCSRLSSIARPALFTILRFNDTDVSKTHRIIAALEQDPRFPAMVRKLLINLPCLLFNLSVYDHVYAIAARFVKLEELTLDCTFADCGILCDLFDEVCEIDDFSRDHHSLQLGSLFQYNAAFLGGQSMSLPEYRFGRPRLMLEKPGSCAYDNLRIVEIIRCTFRPNSAIFNIGIVSKTVEKLTLKYCTLSYDERAHKKHQSMSSNQMKGTTTLTELHLSACDIDDPFPACILENPRALKRLSMDSCTFLDRDAREQFLDALGSQKGSFELFELCQLTDVLQLDPDDVAKALGVTFEMCMVERDGTYRLSFKPPTPERLEY